MAITTYSELQASVADWLNRSDLTAVIPDFITMAEAWFNRRLRTEDMVGKATLSTSNAYFNLPLDHLEPISLKQTGTNVEIIRYVSPDELNQIRMQTLDGTTLRYFSIIGTSLHVLPAPSEATTVELTYFKKITALSDENTSNWLLSAAPDLYLYGTLLQAEPYLKNDERVPLWAAGAQKVIDELNEQSSRARYPQGRLAARRRTFG